MSSITSDSRHASEPIAKNITSPGEALNSHPMGPISRSEAILLSEVLAAEREEMRRLDNLRLHRFEQMVVIDLNDKNVENKKRKCCECVMM